MRSTSLASETQSVEARDAPRSVSIASRATRLTDAYNALLISLRSNQFRLFYLHEGSPEWDTE
jgi:hypothetical protein